MQSMALRVLPSMTLRTFRLKVAKSFKAGKAAQKTLGLWIKMQDGTFAALNTADDTLDLAWLGVEDSSDIVLYLD